MYRLLYPLTLFLLAGSLFAADPFAGTWKLNVAKSKLGPNPQWKEITLLFEVAGDQYMVTDKRIPANGSPILVKYTLPRTGGPGQFLEGAPPGLSTAVAKRKVDSRIADATDTKDGKVIATFHAVVSADGMSIRATIKGIDAQGKKFETAEVYDKQ